MGSDSDSRSGPPQERPPEIEVICPKCGGEGVWESAPYGYSHIDGHLLTHTYRCDACGGSGSVWVETDLISMDDLAAMSGDDDPYSAFAYRGGNP